jgi:LEA14-like dessication related protein
MTRLAALACSALLVSGCAGLQRLAELSLTPPTVTVERATVAALDVEGATVLLELTLKNPNDVAFEVARAGWRLEVEETEVGEGQLPGGLAIPARGTAPFSVTVRVRWVDVTQLVERVRRQERVAYRVSGTVGVETPVGVMDLAFKHAGTLPVPRLPTLKLESASADLASLTELTLQLALVVENPNGFPLPGATLTFDLLVNGVAVATGKEATLTPLGAEGQARIILPLRVSLLGAGRAAGTLGGGGGELRLRGTVRAAGLETPVDLKLHLGK